MSSLIFIVFLLEILGLYGSAVNPVWKIEGARCDCVKVMLVINSIGCIIFLTCWVAWLFGDVDPELKEAINYILLLMGLFHGGAINMIDRVILKFIRATERPISVGVR